MEHFITQNTAEPMGVKECRWGAQDTQLILKHRLVQGVEFLHHQISERNLEMCVPGEGIDAAVAQGKIGRHVLKVTKETLQRGRDEGSHRRV
jgi:hypothetical protein